MNKTASNSIKLLVIVTALLLFIPFLMGQMLEKKAHVLINRIHTPELKVSLQDYKSGWFTSQAKLQLALAPQLTPNAPPLTLVGHESIIHGPLIITHDRNHKLHIMIGQAYITNTIEHAHTSIDVNILVTLTGKLVISTNIPTLHFSSAQPQGKLQSTIKGIQAHIRLGKRFTESSGWIKFNQTTLHTLELTHHIKGLTLKFDLKQNQQGLWLGTRIIKIENLNWTVENNHFLMKSLRIALANTQHNQRIDTELDEKIKSVKINHQVYGPHEINLNIDNLALMPLSQLLQQAKTMNQNATLPPEQAHRLLPGLLSLASYGFDIKVNNVLITTGWGPLRAQASASLPITDTGSDHWNNLTRHSQAEVSIQLPTQLLHYLLTAHLRKQQPTQQKRQGSKLSPDVAAQQKIDALIAQGYLRATKKEISIGLTFQNGQLLINGKPPTASLLQMSKAQPMPAQQPHQVRSISTPPARGNHHGSKKEVHQNTP